ncbi:MAG: hypothetical protein AVDCRST_MAG59-2053, partial [uncultured Thermomicrobiales bacterium]
WNCSARCSSTRRIANAPSPTVVAPRFVGPCPTSPTANTPGRPVSRKAGGRSSGHPSAVAAWSPSYGWCSGRRR